MQPGHVTYQLHAFGGLSPEGHPLLRPVAGAGSPEQLVAAAKHFNPPLLHYCITANICTHSTIPLAGSPVLLQNPPANNGNKLGS